MQAYFTGQPHREGGEGGNAKADAKFRFSYLENLIDGEPPDRGYDSSDSNTAAPGPVGHQVGSF